MRLNLRMNVCVWAIVGLLAAGTTWAQGGDGSIVGWDSQVVGVDLSADLVAVAAGFWHSLALKADGSIVAWGRNDYGQCDVPAPNARFLAIAGGAWHSLGLKRGPDCNSNGIVDACDLDCGTNGGPCDIPGCGQSEDFNTNGIPDECENHAPVAVCQDVTVDAGSFNCLGVVGPGGVDDGSYDPDGDPLTLTLYPPGPYPLGVTIVSLTVTDDSNLSDTCTATVTVVDTTPPLVACVIGVTIDCDESTDPSNTGQAWATDNCDPAPVLAFTDNVVVPPCPADPAQFVIERTWTGTDSYGNSSSCLSTITVLKLVHSGIIIKQGACPAPLNRNSHGVLPVGLLGTADFDVTTVDPGSVVLSREDCVAGTVAPHEGPPGPHTVVSDVGTPFGGDPCACHELEGDGIDDLSMKFKVDDLVAALGLDSLNAGALVELVVTGTLADGCAFIATDCVRLVPPVSTPGTLIVVSNLDGAWVNTTPVDATQESGGFAGFERSYEPGAVVTLAAEGAAGEGTFHAWEINGAPQAAGQSVIEIKIAGTVTARAIYTPQGGEESDDIASTTPGGCGALAGAALIALPMSMLGWMGMRRRHAGDGMR